MVLPANDGGTAFPIHHSDAPGAYAQEPGMSLRDYFAGQALVACADWDNPEEAARHSFTLADAMLAARAPDVDETGATPLQRANSTILAMCTLFKRGTPEAVAKACELAEEYSAKLLAPADARGPAR